MLVGDGYLTLFFKYHLGLYIMQASSYLGKIVRVTIWFRMVLTQIWFVYTKILSL